MKLVNYMESYAALHKNVIFVFNIEFTSIVDDYGTSAESLAFFQDALLDLGDYNSDLYKMQMKHITKYFLAHLPPFQKINPNNFHLVPFASLNTHRTRSTSSSRGTWRNELNTATRKKLGKVIKDSQIFSHHHFVDYLNCKDYPSACSSSKPQLFIFLTEEVVEEIVYAAFYVSKRNETAMGMRAIEQIWVPQIYDAIKEFYETQSNKHCKYGGYLSINFHKFGNHSGDIDCQCNDSIVWKWYIMILNFFISFNWGSYGPLVSNLRNCALALEKIFVYCAMV